MKLFSGLYPSLSLDKTFQVTYMFGNLIARHIKATLRFIPTGHIHLSLHSYHSFCTTPIFCLIYTQIFKPLDMYDQYYVVGPWNPPKPIFSDFFLCACIVLLKYVITYVFERILAVGCLSPRLWTRLLIGILGFVYIAEIYGHF